MTYLANLIFIPFYFFALRFITKTKNANYLFCWIVTIHATLFRALANPYNYTDIEGYSNAYNTIATWSFHEAIIDVNIYTPWGYGYVFFNWVVSRFFSSPEFFFFFVSIISVSGSILYYNKMSYKPLAPIMFYLIYHMMYLMGFGVIRQHLAMPFLLFALYYLDNYKISISLAIIAMLLHTPSVIFMPFFLYRYLYQKSSLFVASLIFIFLFVIVRIEIESVLSSFERYEASYESHDSSNNIVPFLIIGYLAFLLLISRINRKINEKRDSNLFLFVIYGLILSGFCLGMPAMGRLTIPVIYTLPAAMTLLYKYGRKKEYTLYISSLFIFMLTANYIKIRNGFDLYNYYSFFWEKATRINF